MRTPANQLVLWTGNLQLAPLKHVQSLHAGFVGSCRQPDWPAWQQTQASAIQRTAPRLDCDAPLSNFYRVGTC